MKRVGTFPFDRLGTLEADDTASERATVHDFFRSLAAVGLLPDHGRLRRTLPAFGGAPGYNHYYWDTVPVGPAHRSVNEAVRTAPSNSAVGPEGRDLGPRNGGRDRLGDELRALSAQRAAKPRT